MKLSNLFRGDLKYQLLYKFKRGVSIGIALTFKCNYRCSYCNMNMVNGKPRNAKEVGLEEWKKLIDDFPYKLKEIYISGGEPTLMGYFSELINYITEKKILVTLFTNLSRTTGIMLIRSTPYFRIETTLHPEANVDMFKDSVRWLKELGYIVLVDEIDKQTIEGSLVKAKQTQVQELIDGKDRIRFAPDMKMSISCYDYYNT